MSRTKIPFPIAYKISTFSIKKYTVI